ncbi:TetR/AcrR family transcriptional regulator [Kitasatospora sp. NPDC051853]|uniref:TetR/AcrR family transcriptional regulator n=1 Tax=Kitasatospora sp. NPDC051853 TaxID=3364058 RepID=UPI0037998601
MGEELDPAARLLWGPPPTATRGPKAALSLEQIARAGIAIADADGLAAVSMQRVAGALDYTKMALYRYVPGKAELVALMAELAIGAPPEGGSPGWRAALTAWTHGLAEVFAAHPWLLEATLGPRVLGPAELGWMERAVAALDGTPLTGAERLDTVAVLAGHVRSLAQQTRAADGESPEARLAAAVGSLVEGHRERFPASAAAMASVRPEQRDAALDFGLERFLDGLAVLIDGR